MAQHLLLNSLRREFATSRSSFLHAGKKLKLTNNICNSTTKLRKLSTISSNDLDLHSTSSDIPTLTETTIENDEHAEVEKLTETKTETNSNSKSELENESDDKKSNIFNLSEQLDRQQQQNPYKDPTLEDFIKLGGIYPLPHKDPDRRYRSEKRAFSRSRNRALRSFTKPQLIQLYQTYLNQQGNKTNIGTKTFTKETLAIELAAALWNVHDPDTSTTEQMLSTSGFAKPKKFNRVAIEQTQEIEIDPHVLNVLSRHPEYPFLRLQRTHQVTISTLQDPQRLLVKGDLASLKLFRNDFKAWLKSVSTFTCKKPSKLGLPPSIIQQISDQYCALIIDHPDKQDYYQITYPIDVFSSQDIKSSLVKASILDSSRLRTPAFVSEEGSAMFSFMPSSTPTPTQWWQQNTTAQGSPFERITSLSKIHHSDIINPNIKLLFGSHQPNSSLSEILKENASPLLSHEKLTKASLGTAFFNPEGIEQTFKEGKSDLLSTSSLSNALSQMRFKNAQLCPTWLPSSIPNFIRPNDKIKTETVQRTIYARSNEYSRKGTLLEDSTFLVFETPLPEDNSPFTLDYLLSNTRYKFINKSAANILLPESPLDVQVSYNKIHNITSEIAKEWLPTNFDEKPFRFKEKIHFKSKNYLRLNDYTVKTLNLSADPELDPQFYETEQSENAVRAMEKVTPLSSSLSSSMPLTFSVPYIYSPGFRADNVLKFAYTMVNNIIPVPTTVSDNSERHRNYESP